MLRTVPAGKSRFGCGTITTKCFVRWTNLWCEPRTDTCSKPSCSNRRMISRLSRSKGPPDPLGQIVGVAYRDAQAVETAPHPDPPPASGEREKGSHPLHKTIHHALFAGFVEVDRQLVAIDGDDVAV